MEGGTKAVGSSFWCYNNQLVSLEGAPTEVGGSFYYRDKIADMDDIKAKDKLMLTEKPTGMEALKQVQGEDIGEHCDIEIGLL